jgi:hypothetical protein
MPIPRSGHSRRTTAVGPGLAEGLWWGRALRRDCGSAGALRRRCEFGRTLRRGCGGAVPGCVIVLVGKDRSRPGAGHPSGHTSEVITVLDRVRLTGRLGWGTGVFTVLDRGGMPAEVLLGSPETDRPAKWWSWPGRRSPSRGLSREFVRSPTGISRENQPTQGITHEMGARGTHEMGTPEPGGSRGRSPDGSFCPDDGILGLER